MQVPVAVNVRQIEPRDLTNKGTHWNAYVRILTTSFTVELKSKMPLPPAMELSAFNNMAAAREEFKLSVSHEGEKPIVLSDKMFLLFLTFITDAITKMQTSDNICIGAAFGPMDGVFAMVNDCQAIPGKILIARPYLVGVELANELNTPPYKVGLCVESD